MLIISFAPRAHALTAVVEVNESQFYTEHKNSRFGGTELTRGYAPHPVFFEGWKSSPRDEIVDYHWDFGDGSAPYHGFNAARVYEIPGTYTVTLTVTDAAEAEASDSIEIEVLPRDGTTYYVDAQLGDDSNPGTSPGAGAWRTATHAFQGMATGRYDPGDQILFKRSQTFAIDSGVIRPGHWVAGYGYMFGAHGTGAKPVIRHVGTSTVRVIDQFGLGLAHFAVVDLDFRLTSSQGVTAGDLFYASAPMTNVLFLRCDLRDFSFGLTFSGGWSPEAHQSGVFVVGCTTYNSWVTHFYAVAYRTALLDNSFDLSGNHVVYLPYISKGVISRNSFSRPAFGRTALRLSGGSDFFYPTNNVWISENACTGWIDPETEGRAHNGGGVRYNLRLVDLSPNADTDQAMEYVVFEHNTVTDAEVLLGIGSYHNLIVRDNVFQTVDPNPPSYRIKLGDDFDHRPLKNIQITNNTIVSNEDRADTAAIFRIRKYIGPAYIGMNQHENIVISNNTVKMVGGEARFVYLTSSNSEALLAGVKGDDNIIFRANEEGLYQRGGDHMIPELVYSLQEWRDLTGNDLNTVVITTDTPLTVQVTGQGSVITDPPLDEISFNDIVTLTAVPAPKWGLLNWSGALSGSVNPTQLLVDRDKIVIAHFTQILFTVVVNVVGDGSVSLSPDPPYSPGQQVTLTATPGPGAQFLGWTGALSGTANPATLVMDADKTVTAGFASDPYELVLIINGQGDVIATPPPPYEQDDEVLLTAQPELGWSFDGWSGDVTVTGPDSATVTMDQAKMVTARFAQAEFEIRITIEGAGRVTREPAPPYKANDVVVLTGSPDPDWFFVEWSGAVTGSANPVSVVMDRDMEVVARFTKAGGQLPGLTVPVFHEHVARRVSLPERLVPCQAK